MRGALLAAFVVAGCGGGGSSMPASTMSASFAALAGANTSGVAISSMTATCNSAVASGLACSVSELPENKGRIVSVSFNGPVVAGMDYRIGGPEQAGVLFEDPTTYGTASGDRLWQAVAGTGAIHIVQWTAGSHVALSYYASMAPLGSPAAGTFDLTGDGNINNFVAQ